MNSQPSLSAIVKKMNELYVMTRSKYLVMNPSGWSTLTVTRDNKTLVLNDGLLKHHIQQKGTIGVFSGKHLSKFICFDVDTSEMIESKFLTYRLVDVLARKFNIPLQFINVSMSGYKGYHVEIFFTEPMDINKLKKFYDEVLLVLEEKSHRIEFRPTYFQGVKLPLGKHMKSHTKCWYCDNITLETVCKDEYILNVKQIDTFDFMSLVNDVIDDSTLSLPVHQAESFELVAQETVISTKSIKEKEDYVIEIMKLGRLKYPQTRHKTTLLMAMLLVNSYGYEHDEAKKLILEVMKNTPNDFFSKSTKWDYIVSETDRIVELVAEKKYMLATAKSEIKIYKDEIMQILCVEKHHLRKLLFSILIHAKRYANENGVFYMTYKQMSEMGNTSYRTDLIKYVGEIEAEGLVTVVTRNELDKITSKQSGKFIKKPNTYKINIESNCEQYITITNDKDINFIEIVPQLLDKNEVKDTVSSSDFYKLFKSQYKEDIKSIVSKHLKRRSKI